MEPNEEAVPFRTFLSDAFNKILDIPKPAKTDGIIYKRYPQNKTGKFTEEEMDYLITNQIPY